jgi:TusA-related sulfurtransferase
MPASFWQVDCRNLPAPYPLLGARAAVALMDVGDVLGLLLTDADCALDASAWCRMTGNRLVGRDQRGDVHRLLIQKGRTSCPNP